MPLVQQILAMLRRLHDAASSVLAGAWDQLSAWLI
jgi:hypothetical protein